MSQIIITNKSTEFHPVYVFFLLFYANRLIHCRSICGTTNHLHIQSALPAHYSAAVCNVIHHK